MPTSLQAGAYSAVYNFLVATDDIGSTVDGRAVVARMKQRPSQDPVYGESAVRPDGRRVTPVYVLSVKDAAVDNPSDVFSVLQTIPPENGYRSVAEGHCSMVSTAVDVPK